MDREWFNAILFFLITIFSEGYSGITLSSSGVSGLERSY